PWVRDAETANDARVASAALSRMRRPTRPFAPSLRQAQDQRQGFALSRCARGAGASASSARPFDRLRSFGKLRMIGPFDKLRANGGGGDGDGEGSAENDHPPRIAPVRQV